MSGTLKKDSMISEENDDDIFDGGSVSPVRSGSPRNDNNIATPPQSPKDNMRHTNSASPRKLSDEQISPRVTPPLQNDNNRRNQTPSPRADVSDNGGDPYVPDPSSPGSPENNGQSIIPGSPKPESPTSDDQSRTRSPKPGSSTGSDPHQVRDFPQPKSPSPSGAKVESGRHQKKDSPIPSEAGSHKTAESPDPGSPRSAGSSKLNESLNDCIERVEDAATALDDGYPYTALHRIERCQELLKEALLSASRATTQSPTVTTLRILNDKLALLLEETELQARNMVHQLNFEVAGSSDKVHLNFVPGRAEERPLEINREPISPKYDDSKYYPPVNKLRIYPEKSGITPKKIPAYTSHMTQTEDLPWTFSEKPVSNFSPERHDCEKVTLPPRRPLCTSYMERGEMMCHLEEADHRTKDDDRNFLLYILARFPLPGHNQTQFEQYILPRMGNQELVEEMQRVAWNYRRALVQQPLYSNDGDFSAVCKRALDMLKQRAEARSRAIRNVDETDRLYMDDDESFLESICTYYPYLCQPDRQDESTLLRLRDLLNYCDCWHRKPVEERLIPVLTRRCDKLQMSFASNLAFDTFSSYGDRAVHHYKRRY